MAILPANINIKSRFPQADERRMEFFEDDLGRGYHASVDKKGEPVEDPKPTGWCAPQTPAWARGLLNPPGNLLTIRRAPGKSPRVAINLGKWITEQEDATGDFEKHAFQVIEHASGGLNTTEIAKNPPPIVARRIGEGPFPGLEFVQAILDSDPWACGLSPEIPAWAVPLLPQLRRKARIARLLSQEQMRLLATEERREMLHRTAEMNRVEASRVATEEADPRRETPGSGPLKYPAFVSRFKGKNVAMSEIAHHWTTYKRTGQLPAVLTGV